MSEELVIASEPIKSRLFIGSARYPNHKVMLDSIKASGAEVVTVAIRRINLKREGDNIIDLLKGYRILPNTAGCYTARDAVVTARLAREALGTDWIKLEVIGDGRRFTQTRSSFCRQLKNSSAMGSLFFPTATTIP